MEVVARPVLSVQVAFVLFDGGSLWRSAVERPRPRARAPLGPPCTGCPPLDLEAADPVDEVEAAGGEASRCCRWRRMEAPRSSRPEDFPSAGGHLPIQGLWEDAAAARHRHVLLLAGDIVMQKNLSVQNLIERCLQLYMNQKEVVATLSLEAKIEPSFTELVWQKLEEENREFFKAYYLRLLLKNQITAFNRLLEDQFQLMNKDYSSGVPSMPLTNGSNSTPLKQDPCFLPESGAISAVPNGVMHNGSSGGLVNGTPSSDQLMYGGKGIHGPHNVMNASTNVLPAQNASALLFGPDNGTTIKTESGYSTNADFAFCGNAFLESCQSIGDASGGSFSSSELNGQPLNDSLLDMESSSFGFLGQIPRNFSFSDLTEGFNQNTEILENYGRSPFLPSEQNNFSDSTGGEHTG